jgi:hypothetical protein
MRPSHKVLPKALVLTLLAGLLAVGSAPAQDYQSALRLLDLGSDVARSPRLLGMGSLSLSVPDHNQRLTLWDFAHSPLGAYEADSSSGMELRPGSGSASGDHLGATNLEREDLAGRASGMGFEVFNRDAQGSAWGATGNLRSIRTDNLYDLTTETRHTVSYPDVRPIITGPFPYWGKGKLHYAVNLLLGHEQFEDQYRDLVTNAAGEFISMDGNKIGAPSLFNPIETKVRHTGAGLAASYAVAKHATLALGYDATGSRILAVNNSPRSTSEIRETRPYGTVQATLVGTLGNSFEYGLDERNWTSRSQQDWLVSFSSGVGAVPLQGTGKLLSRKETGNAFDGRFRWTSGKLQLAGQYWTLMTRADYTPPSAGDPQSFNVFLNQLYYRLGADTLSLPDSAVANRDQNNVFGYAGGLSWKLKRGVAGLEYHWARDMRSTSISGGGPKAISYDLRAGLEYQCSPIVAGRIGAGMLWRDPDDFMRNDTWKGESASLGLGLTPPGATWGLDLGWSMAWMRTDYPDPLVHRSSHQQLQSLLHWRF